MFSATSLGLVVLMSLSWYFSPEGGMRNLAIWTSVSLSPPWDIRAYPSRTSPRYIMYSHQRSLSVSSMSCKETKSVSFRNGQSSKYFSIYQHSLCSGPSSRNIRYIVRIGRFHEILYIMFESFSLRPIYITNRERTCFDFQFSRTKKILVQV